MKSTAFQNRVVFLLLTGITAAVYLIHLPSRLFAGDAGDFLAAIATRGIPHPPGYPLYTGFAVVFSFIPFGSLISKTGLLSVVPAVCALLFLYDTLRILSGKRIAALIASLSLAFVYPFWLYSEVVEVFSLNNLFLSVLLWLLVRWSISGDRRHILLASFVFGLSLSHHLIILFLLPAMVYFLILRPVHRSLIPACAALFVAGLAPYGYVVLSAQSYPALNWMGPPTWKNFIALVTREGYGTFRSAQHIGHEPVLRATNLFAFADLLVKDFRVFGCLAIAAGFWHLIRTGRRWLLTVIGLAAGSYLFFLFYASFPLMTDFLLGTFERFILPLYIVLTIPLTFGLIQIQQWISALVKRRRIAPAVMAVLLLYPAGLFLLNQPKIRAVQHDPSVERVGQDILSSAPPDSVVLLSMDIPLFSTQYAYYVLRTRPDVRLVHFFKLWLPVHREPLQKEFPSLHFPDSYDSPNAFMQEFLDTNARAHPLFSSVPFAVDSGQWVPWGLLYRFISSRDTLSVDDILQDNARLWSTFQTPWRPEEMRTKPLLATDIPWIYAQARTETGYFLATKGKTDAALDHLLGALQWNPDHADALLTLGQVYIQLKRCDDAKAQLDRRLIKVPDDPATYYALYLTHTQCFTDAQKAKEYHMLYEEKTKQSETKLKEL